MFKNNEYIITQRHGRNVPYYSQFWKSRLKSMNKKYHGHEGDDTIPGTDDWTVFSAPMIGQCVQDEDDSERGKAYGKYLTIWYSSIDIALQYCHLEKNFFGSGDSIPAGSPIGVMGETGNTKGAHVHLNAIATKNGYRIKELGNWGRIDPFLSLLILYGPPRYIEGQSWESFIDTNPEYRGFRYESP